MKKVLFPCLLFALFITSCKKESILLPQASQSDPQLIEAAPTTDAMYSTSAANKQRIRTALENLCVTFAKLINNSSEFRILLKQKAMLRFDGDYDILYSQIKSYTLSNGKTVEQALAALNSNAPTLAAGIPKLNVSVPVECDNWTTASFIPNVAAQPFGLREDSLVNIKTYKANGTLQLMNAHVDPTVPVVVLGVCERVDENEELRPEFVDSPNGDRVSGGSEYVEKINCPDLSEIESWASGAPEIWLTVTGYISNSHTSQPPTSFTQTEFTKQFFKPGKRKDVDNRDWTVNRMILAWYTNPNSPVTSSVYADAMDYRWLEEDYFIPGDGIDITTSLSASMQVNVNGQNQTYNPNTSITWHLEDDDDEAGHMPVHFYDNILTVYNTGRMKWKNKN